MTPPTRTAKGDRYYRGHFCRRAVQGGQVTAATLITIAARAGSRCSGENRPKAWDVLNDNPLTRSASLGAIYLRRRANRPASSRPSKPAMVPGSGIAQISMPETFAQ